jgi:hypothetical protein
MAEIRMPGAGRNDQEIIWNTPIAAENLQRLFVDTGDLAEEYLCVALSMKDAADRRRNISRREASGRDLVEERLKEVVIAPIDHDDLHRLALECVCRRQSAEACADDDDTRRFRLALAMSLAGDASRARGIVAAERCAEGWALLAISGLLSSERLPQRGNVCAPTPRETRHRLEREPHAFNVTP